MLKTIGNIIYDYYQFFMLPFLSISIFYAMEYMSRGVEFFVNEKGVKWRFLSFCALMQFFVSLVVILSVSAMFKSDALQEYQTLQLVAIILLGTTPFNISILIWVAIKLEIYRLMQNRYKEELKDLIKAESFIGPVFFCKTPKKCFFMSAQRDSNGYPKTSYYSHHLKFLLLHYLVRCLYRVNDWQFLHFAA